MRPHYPESTQIPALRKLWQEAFGDSDAFLDGFFRSGFSPDRCRCIIGNGRAKCALYWFDCTLEGGRYAYLYAVATAKSDRGRGLCKLLMKDTHALLQSSGYTGVILVPGEKSLFSLYERLGYQVCTTVSETIRNAAPSEKSLTLQALSADKYAALRRKSLPKGAVLQEGAALSFLAGYARFACGEDFLMAYSVEDRSLICHELLGNTDLGAVLCSLGCTEGRFRTPGSETPFAMFLPLQPGAPIPRYFGLALD